MKNLICIISGEPNSINSEIIGKVLKMKKKFNEQNFFLQHLLPTHKFEDIRLNL